MQASRSQILFTILAGVFLLGTVLIFGIFALAPDAAVVYRPFLLTSFVVTLFVCLVCIAWLLRGLLRPYNQLVGEAKRAPVAHSSKTQNEAAFVLETFQTVIAQLQDQQAELKRLGDHASARADSAERFSEHIVASMPTGLIAFDAAGNTTLTNGPARDLLANGLDASGAHVRTIFASIPALADLVVACLHSGRVFRREEIEVINGSGQGKRFGATVAPIDPVSGSGARGALCLITDITEVMRLREEVALKRNLESLGEMSAGLAHEFKNAMAALHGYAQFLQSVDQNEQGKAATEALLQEVRNLSEMTTSFLNFARPQPLQLEDVPLDELIQECARDLSSLFDERRVELLIESSSSAPPLRSLRLGGESREDRTHRVSAEPASERGSSPTVREGSNAGEPHKETECLEIRADLRMLRQALLNLLRNAAESISEDKTIRRVAVRTSIQNDQDKEWVAISIQDTGDGIADVYLQKIFIPFFTTKTQGHGIGLALAHRVITEHGGTLTVSNAPDGGALFTVRLPR
ncbi:MAG: two-component system, NtrC family, sensor histidine kinase PilS [Blastocatellia bacterium]|jgi:signal transduction histidine kinase|nr:two-component system, NtrC family, sensor histidine kinase PilS [Blastocatellia bacterium]